MSALRGSRTKASLSVAIAPCQSSATSAFLPAAKSGSSCAQSASDPINPMVVQIGHSSVVSFAAGVGSDAPSQIAIVSGPGPCIHHWGIEVEDRDSYVAKIKANGGTVISEPGEGALKFRAPDGTVAEIVGAGRYKKKTGKEPA